MNETSHVTSCGANGSSVSVRAFVRSSTVTRASLAEARMELAVADVERDHARRAALQQHVGEPARRGADVEAVEPGRIDAERVERVRELRARPARRTAAAARPRAAPSSSTCSPGFAWPGHEAGHHERLRLGAALGEAALDEQDVEPLPRHDVRAASRATISASTEVSAGISASRASARAAASSASSRALASPTSTT